ncbi:MAG: TPM domain-containing protein [Lachnospiraceae bacterium]|nr:TPM domain-containing protein [Lachnospiraceae bacterium]
MKNYLRHFRFLFIALGVLLVIFIGVKIAAGSDQKEYTRTNDQCTETERVFDYADKLTDAQEDDLRELIAEKEKEVGCDIILVTINDSSIASDYDMMNYADDFYDNHMFGYDEPWGDGALYLDNWANGYCWFSTCGRVEMEYSTYEINELIDDVCATVNADPYKAYKTYVNSLSRTMSGKAAPVYSMGIVLFAAFIITLIYVIVGVYHNKGKKTTTASTYVAGGRPVFNDRRDLFVTKHTTSRHIERSSGGGGGGGGHHISSGGHSHGGGGGRH